ncbi:MAG: LTA synthase family protein [Treponema sp.]|jgi:phosphoglycerol transferase|nr:LTA synthase family protein [Treponema sp.]
MFFRQKSVIKIGGGGGYVVFKYLNKLLVFIVVMLPVAGFIYLINAVGLPSYIKYYQTPTVFYEENYIFPEDAHITFPELKRNLIVIFVEGLETGYLPIENGGAFTENLMPEVVYLAENNINFSLNEGIGGPVQLSGAGWTIAGIVAYYSGLPLAVRFMDGNNYGSLGSKFLPGAYSIGDILHDAGYRSYFILGSDIAFGGRDKYFKTHRDTVIYDYNYFHDNNYIPNSYSVWWGIEDRKLYEFSKTKISEISSEEPFFITLLTVDTHPSDGYLDDEAEIVFDSQYKNVIRDMSRQLYAFVDWLKQQDFYENTTIVILGDHLYMDWSFFPNTDGTTESYNRYPINIFINSLLNQSNVKNRIFSHFDMLPTIIESIGGIFDSEGLALGRSMLNGHTLLEKYGEAEINRQLRSKSSLYDLFWRQ